MHRPAPNVREAHGHVTQSRLLIRTKPYRRRSGCLGGSVWTTFSAPSSVTSSTWTRCAAKRIRNRFLDCHNGPWILASGCSSQGKRRDAGGAGGACVVRARQVRV